MARIRSYPIAIATTVLIALIAAPCVTAESCQWDLSGRWEIWQTNVHTASFDLTQNAAGELGGTAKHVIPRSGGAFSARMDGPIKGRITGDKFSFVVAWNNGSRGEYWGKVQPDRTIGGTTLDLANPQNAATWYARTGKAICKSVAAPPPTAPKGPVKKLGKKLPRVATAKNDVDIHEGPDGKTKIIGMLKGGTTAPVMAQSFGWFRMKVNVPGGYGWVAIDHLNFTY